MGNDADLPPGLWAMSASELPTLVRVDLSNGSQVHAYSTEVDTGSLVDLLQGGTWVAIYVSQRGFTNTYRRVYLNPAHVVQILDQGPRRAGFPRHGS